MRNKGAANLEFRIFRVGTAEVRVQVRTVSDLGHHGLGKAQRPATVIIFDDAAPGVTSRVGSVIVSTVVIHGPVHELEMAVAAHRIEVKEIRQTKLAHAQVQPPYWQSLSERERTLVADFSLVA